MITDHRIDNLNSLLDVERVGEKTSGGAFAEYIIRPCKKNISYEKKFNPVQLIFQHDVPDKVGMTGITNETLLAVVLDRMRAFNSGEFPCRENSLAITKIEEALLWLGKRATDRKNSGVESKSAV